MSEVIDRHFMSVFPTYIFKCSVDDMSLCDELEDGVKKLWEAGNGSFVKKTKFISYDNLQTMEDFNKLNEIVLNEANGILDFLKVIRDDHYISCMWANVTDSSHTHMVHIHPNSYLSGILYLKTPEKCGLTAFGDPRPGARIIQPDYYEVNETNGGTFRNVPKKGDMLMWHSWLPHGVEHSEDDSEQERIAIAFNVMIKGKARTMTQSIDF